MAKKRPTHPPREAKAVAATNQPTPAAVRHLLAAVAILIVGTICYANSFQVPFVLDDVTSILGNPLVKDFHFTLKPRILGDLSFALNYRLHGFELTGYHVANLMLHLANALLVYLLVQITWCTPMFTGVGGKAKGLKSTVPQLLGFAAALFFVSHPLQTQAVTYLAQRVAVLASFCYLGALCSYVASRLVPSRTRATLLLSLSLLLAVAGVLTKENAVTIPLAVLLYELTFFRGALKERLFHLAWYIVPLLAALLILLARVGVSPDLLGDVGRLTAESSAPPRLTYLLTQMPVVVNYLRLFFFPIGQNLDHDIPLRSSPADPVVIAALLVLVGVAAIGWRLWLRGRRAPAGEGGLAALAGYGIGWFFLTLSVESGVIPIRDVMFEHRLYLPSVGLVMAVTAAIWQLAAWAKGDRARVTRFLGIVSVVGLLLATATFLRNRVWRSDVTLWEDVVSKSPAKARPHGSLGHVYQRAGRLDDALRSYETAVRLAPNDHIAHNNLGTIYLALNRPTDALDQFREVLRTAPANVKAHYNMGLAYAKLEQFKEAEAAYRQALKLDSNNDQALNNLGIALFRQGRTKEALEAFREAVSTNPGNDEAARNLDSLEKALGTSK